MKKFLRIKYVEKSGLKVEEKYEKVKDFAEAMSISLTYDREESDGTLVVLESHYFQLGE